MLTEKVLVLNRTWAPVNIASVRRALTLVYVDMARIVHPHDFSTFSWEGWLQTGETESFAPRLRSATFEFLLPEIIVLTAYNGVFMKEVKFTRRNIFERDGNVCQYCGRRRDPREMTLDHIVPRSRGGNSSWENVVLACLPCNSRKGCRLPDEAGMSLLRPAVKPEWATRVGVKIGPKRKSSWLPFINGKRGAQAGD